MQCVNLNWSLIQAKHKDNNEMGLLEEPEHWLYVTMLDSTILNNYQLFSWFDSNILVIFKKKESFIFKTYWNIYELNNEVPVICFKIIQCWMSGKRSWGLNKTWLAARWRLLKLHNRYLGGHYSILLWYMTKIFPNKKLKKKPTKQQDY